MMMQIPVDPECQLRMYPEIKLPEDQKKAWFADRQGIIVGRDTAARFGWKVGDRVPLQATIWRKKDNSTTWEFNVSGIFDGEPGTDTSSIFFHYEYFDEGRLFGEGNVGWYVVRIADPERAADVAERLDRLFANSMAETKTTTEKAFMQSFANQMGDIGLIARSVGAAVFFTLLLGVGNTMAQSVRERTSELAVLKALGFSDGAVLALVLAEAGLLAIVGGGGGLALAWVLISRGGDPTGGMLPGFFLPSRALLFGVSLVLALGFAAGVFPAVRAMRLRIVDALRRA
jgi:putative ABC transport system permease protein